jgi:predicted transposase YbfD/YdcC
MTTGRLAICQHFRNLRDPRRDHLKRHLLIDIVTIAICGVIGGANTWVDIETFATNRQAWLAQFLQLPNGIPSHDTIERVFSLINPRSFQRCVLAWLRPVAEALNIKHIAIDGKTLRGSVKPSSPHHYLHLVSAWASEARLTLGQVAVDEKSNEITAIPRLLEILNVKGALVTIDAMGCQKEIAAKIVEKKGDYLLIVKENQEHLYEDILDIFVKAYDQDGIGLTMDMFATEEKGHGREERRSYTILTNPEGIRNQEAWSKLKVIGQCLRERTVAGETSEEMHLFIGSRVCSAKAYGEALRNHWGIENNLHWQVDVTFAEDANRTQQREAAENFGWLRRLALMQLQKYSGKGSIQTRRYAATLNEKVLEEILNL